MSGPRSDYDAYKYSGVDFIMFQKEEFDQDNPYQKEIRLSKNYFVRLYQIIFSSK